MSSLSHILGSGAINTSGISLQTPTAPTPGSVTSDPLYQTFAGTNTSGFVIPPDVNGNAYYNDLLDFLNSRNSGVDASNLMNYVSQSTNNHPNDPTAPAEMLLTLFVTGVPPDPSTDPSNNDAFFTYPLHASLTSSETTQVQNQLKNAITTDYSNAITDPTDPSLITPQSSVNEQNQALTSFSAFLKQYPYNGNGDVYPAGSTPQQKLAYFIQSWQQFLNPTVALTTAAADQSNPPLPSYQTYYQIATGDNNPQDFSNALNSFVQAEINKNGYFLPSQDLSAWITQLPTNNEIPYVTPTDGGGNPFGIGTNNENFSKTVIINNIYALISAMLSTTQDVAAAQASRLTVLTQWQKAYSDQIAQLHTFTRVDVAAGGGTGSLADQDTARGSLNTQSNANWRDTMSTNRSIISNSSKALQSSVNQSNDEVSQQATLATSIITELSTILSAIFR